MSAELVSFSDYPEFTPNVTPQQMFQYGVFGGTYWRPIHSSIIGKNLADQHLEYSWAADISAAKLTSTVCNARLNYYGVKAGSSLDEWESKGWIVAQDPYGWVQWYCRFYEGRRTQDDRRQIDRWLNYAGPNGRWRRRLENQINKGPEFVSKVVQQGLLQWAYLS